MTDENSALLINPGLAPGLRPVVSGSPTVTNWSPRENRVVIMDYENLAPSSTPEYIPQGHHLFSLAAEPRWVEFEVDLGRQRPVQVRHGYGSTFLCPAGAPHQATWHQPLCNTVFCLNEGFVNQVAAEMIPGNGLEFIPRPVIHDPNLYHLAMALKVDLTSPPQAHLQLYYDHVMAALVMYLVKHYTSRCLPLVDPGELDGRRLRWLLDYIELHLHQPMDLDTIAQELAMGELTLCWAFLNRMGRPLYEYVAEQRLKRAQVLVQVGGLPLTEIAQYCGYASVAAMQAQLAGRV